MMAQRYINNLAYYLNEGSESLKEVWLLAYNILGEAIMEEHFQLTIELGEYFYSE